MIGLLNQLVQQSFSSSDDMLMAHPSPSNNIDNSNDKQSDTNEPISESSEEWQTVDHVEHSPVD